VTKVHEDIYIGPLVMSIYVCYRNLYLSDVYLCVNLLMTAREILEHGVTRGILLTH
jgi:hypothetical protein